MAVGRVPSQFPLTGLALAAPTVDNVPSHCLPDRFLTLHPPRKRAMKMNPNSVWFQLITPSDIAFVISLMKNGMSVWKMKAVLFESDDLRKTKAKPLFTSGEGQKRTFGKTTWS